MFKSDDSIWLKFEYILELTQWMYSNEYTLENCFDLAEWAVDLVMFNLKQEKTSDLRNSRSLLSASTTVSGRQSKTQSKRLLAKMQHSNLIMPTILDESTASIDIGSVQSQIEKNAEEEMENLIRKSKRDNMFGKIIYYSLLVQL